MVGHKLINVNNGPNDKMGNNDNGDIALEQGGNYEKSSGRNLKGCNNSCLVVYGLDEDEINHTKSFEDDRCTIEVLRDLGLIMIPYGVQEEHKGPKVLDPISHENAKTLDGSILPLALKLLMWMGPLGRVDQFFPVRS